MPEFVILYGPPASGKTINAKALQERYNCDYVTDEWLGRPLGKEMPKRVLILTNKPGLMGTPEEPELFKSAVRLQVSLAAKDLGDKWIVPDPEYGNKKHPASALTWRGMPQLAKSGVDLIAEERLRQIQQEGWSAKHDDGHGIGELCSAAGAYLFAGDCLANAAAMNPAYHCTLESLTQEILDNSKLVSWPWDVEWLKVSPDPVRNLVKAGALIAAEIDRLQRLKRLEGAVVTPAEAESWAISLHGEDYGTEAFPDKETAIVEGRKRWPGEAFYVGELERPTSPEVYFDSMHWLEHVAGQDDYAGDHADGWDMSSQAQRDELDTQVQRVMEDWLDRHDLRPDFWNVTNAECIAPLLP